MPQSTTRLIAVAMILALSCFAVTRAADKPGADAPKPAATPAAEKPAADDPGPVDGKPGGSIHGYRFEFPCKDPMPENPKEGADGLSGLVKGDPKLTDNFTATKNFGGLREVTSSPKPALASVTPCAAAPPLARRRSLI